MLFKQVTIALPNARQQVRVSQVDMTIKTDVPCHSRCVTLEEPSMLKTGKIENIHRSRFSSVTIKTCDVTYKPHDGRRRKHRRIESLYLIHLDLHRIYRWIISLTKYMIVSLLSLLFCINLNLIYNIYPARIFSAHCVNEVD